MNNENDIPIEILDAARTVSNYFVRQGIAKWECGNICSRNFADNVRAYESFIDFKNENRLVLTREVKTLK